MRPKVWFTCIVLGLGSIGCIDLPEVVTVPEDTDAGTSPEPDATAPTLASTRPQAGAQGVAGSSILELEFSEPMQRDSVHVSVDPPKSVTLSGWNDAGTLAAFTPSTPWSRGTHYTITVEGRDLAGNTLGGSRVFGFTTQSPTEPADTTPPAVTAMSPSQGSNGHPRDTSLKLTFSEPMDRVSVEKAFTFSSPGDYTPGSIGFTWNTDSSEVTINPSNDLPYAANVTWSLSIEARDSSGNMLSSAVSGQFLVVRLETKSITRTEDSSLYGPAPFSRTGSLLIGEPDAQSFSRGFLSFSLGGVPAEAIRIVSADLSWEAASPGDPFYSLGDLIVESVDYGAVLEPLARDFDAPARGEPIVIQGEDYPAGDTRIHLPVTSLVSADLSNRVTQENRSQFRLRFTLDTNHDQKADYLSIRADAFPPKLELSYELP